MPPTDATTTLIRTLDPESQAWMDRLRQGSPDYEAAVRELHVLLLKAARFEVARRRSVLGHNDEGDHEDLAQQSADDALMAVLGKLDQFRGESRFTTWVYKFGLYEAAVKTRRRAWEGRELKLDPEHWPLFADEHQAPVEDAHTRELLRTLSAAIKNDLTTRQREVLVAVTLNGIPIDVLAERLSATRGALYKTLHDARRKLRASLNARGLDVSYRDGGPQR
ncbi:MAG: RNA polymerase sigma factor [Solirubrobacteraceae bacterium]